MSQTSSGSMQQFFELVDQTAGSLGGSEVLLAGFVGEESDFVRFNRSRVRQATSVRQAHVTLTLIDGRRRDVLTLPLTGVATADRASMAAAVTELRSELPSLPEDPYLLYSTEPSQSARIERGRLPAGDDALDAVLSAADGADLVGIYASGPMQRGFASSLGHRHWHEVDSFHFDWSFFHAADKAVKSSYATARWDASELAQRIRAAREQLIHIAQPARTIEPGRYRTYLAPAALDELVWMLNWSGVSEKAQRTKTSCLQKLADGESRLSPRFSLRENTAGGLAPAFDAAGFTKPSAIDIVVSGLHAGSMVSPRTAQEYGIPANGADEDEDLQSADVAGGELTADSALAELGTGVYVGNLWYLNFSDRAQGRITGMTRFASYWVEGGAIVAPLNVMRFDDSVYRMLGTHLVDFTRERDWILNANTYGQRSVETSRMPGALLSELAFTL
jgi:predicted Zn-dependent protease